MATLGRSGDTASLEREESLRRKIKQRKRTKKTSEGRNCASFTAEQSNN